MNDKSNFLAEVIDSSVSNFTAQCWQWDHAPEFGCLVCAQQNALTLFGVVYRVHAGSDDPARSVVAYQKTLLELREQQPQVFTFLKTEFSAVVVGYVLDGQLCYGAAPSPAQLHAFVRHTTVQEYAQLLREPHYLHALFAQAYLLGSIEEVLLALLRQASMRNVLERSMVIDCLEVFNALSDQDYRRLRVLAQRLEPMVASVPERS